MKSYFKHLVLLKIGFKTFNKKSKTNFNENVSLKTDNYIIKKGT